MITDKTITTQSGTQTKKVYSSKPLTGKQARERVQQCKAYVQSLKNGS